MIYGLGSSGFDSESLLAQRQRELQKVSAERQEAEREYAALKAGREYRAQLKSDHRAQLAADVAAKNAPPVFVPPPPPKKPPFLMYAVIGLAGIYLVRRFVLKRG
jgi:hypothetical protein